MIIRIVKMTFASEHVDTFKDIFLEINAHIRDFEGCTHLRLLRDTENTNIFFTYSHWDTDEHLQVYRNSPFFADTWQRTKVLFDAKPEAWSVEEV